MKLPQQISLSAYNLSRRKKTSGQVIAMVSLIMLLVSFSSFLVATLMSELNVSLDLYSSTNFVELSTWHEEYSTLDLVDIDSIRDKFPSINQVSITRNHWSLVNRIASQSIIIDGTAHFGDDSVSDLLSVVIIDYNYSYFSNNTRTEFNLRFSGQSIIKYGRDIQNNGELLLPYSLLAPYGLTPDMVLNAENVAFNIIDGMGENPIFSGRVVGIINHNVNYLGSGHNRIQDDFMLSVVITDAVETGATFNDYRVRFYFDDVLTPAYLVDYIHDNYYYLSAWWLNRTIADRLELVARILSFTQSIILVLVLSIGLAAAFFLYSVIDYNIKQKGAYNGMLRAMGMRSSILIMVLEMVILSLISAAIVALIFFPTVFLLNGVTISLDFFTRFVINTNGAIVALTFITTFIGSLILNIGLTLLSAKLNTPKAITKALQK